MRYTIEVVNEDLPDELWVEWDEAKKQQSKKAINTATV